MVGLAGCTESALNVPGMPVGCDPMGGEVTGPISDPNGHTVRFGAVQATLAAPDLVFLSDGALDLELAIGSPPREITLVFPGIPVFAESGKIVLDEDTTCHAGRFDVIFQFHGELTGWFAVP